MRPIIKEHKPLNFTQEQIDRLLKRGSLPVSLAYKDGKHRRIKKGFLSIGGGCRCCGVWLKFWQKNGIERSWLSFPDAYSTILKHVRLS